MKADTKVETKENAMEIEIVRFIPRKEDGFIITFKVNGFLYSKVAYTFIGPNGKVDGFKILDWCQKEVIFLLDDDKNPLEVAINITTQINKLLLEANA